MEPSLEIKIGDEIITSTGRRGFVDSICDCERCAESEEQYHQITMDEYLESLANGE